MNLGHLEEAEPTGLTPDWMWVAGSEEEGMEEPGKFWLCISSGGEHGVSRLGVEFEVHCCCCIRLSQWTFPDTCEDS